VGQAKARREALRQRMLEECRRWDFPASPWEHTLCAELRNQTVLEVRRAPAEQLAWMRMPTNQCHANVSWYVKNDPSKNSRAVAGWWVQWPDFVLHSVIETDGQLFCITPSYFGEAEFPFIPDPKISWIETGEVYSAVRDGHIIGVGVRACPGFTMARNAIVRDRLLSGLDPLEAGELSDEIIETLMREFVDNAD
jgi:hypothetical protein